MNEPRQEPQIVGESLRRGQPVETMANRLAEETSPYLLQHAHNPVDWYAWGADAFERARRENKPVLLSVGYSACHWCHVMERESFEDADIAQVMNDLFVNIKVDREERPDVDSIYMQAVQAMTGHGGWPMTVFLTPELEPFWAGTYFPPTDRPGIPSFRRVLQAVADAYNQRPEDVRRVAASMREMYAAASRSLRGSGQLSPDLLDRATRNLLGSYDTRDGGFGDAPKFPQAMAMEFLLQRWARARNEAALEAVRYTFQRMARGGIYDQIGGGFARYSVDAQWLVPHFEKMLYDNALLARLGVHLWQATTDELVERVVRETIDWAEREMTSPSGGFYSTLDADSEGEEGKFYLWDDRELRDVLGAEAEALIDYWGVSAEGNFEGRNILHIRYDSRRAPPAALQSAKKKLYDVRAQRVRPARDEKIIASWNGLMLRAVAEAARAFDEPRYREIAVANATFLFREMVRDGRVFRTHKDGVSRIAGFLEDYGAIALGSLAVYELTFESVWLDRARQLCDAILKQFRDEESGGFFDAPSDHEELITRPRDLTDNATPSGTSLAIDLLFRLGDLLGDADMQRRASSVLESIAEPMTRHPLAFGNALTAADFAVHGAIEVALVGRPSDAGFKELARTVGTTYVPSLVVAAGEPQQDSGMALLANRDMRGDKATAYVCRGYVCDAPVTDAAELFDQLRTATAMPARTRP